MEEVSRAPNAPAIEERGRSLYSLVVTVGYIFIEANILCAALILGPQIWEQFPMI